MKTIRILNISLYYVIFNSKYYFTDELGYLKKIKKENINFDYLFKSKGHAKEVLEHYNIKNCNIQPCVTIYYYDYGIKDSKKEIFFFNDFETIEKEFLKKYYFELSSNY